MCRREGSDVDEDLTGLCSAGSSSSCAEAKPLRLRRILLFSACLGPASSAETERESVCVCCESYERTDRQSIDPQGFRHLHARHLSEATSLVPKLPEDAVPSAYVE